MEKSLKLITWDIHDTLIEGITLDGDIGREIARQNCLDLLQREPVLPLMPYVERVLQRFRQEGIRHGIASSYAYQFAMNFLTASSAREYIDPKLISLVHKKAWERMVLDNGSYNKELERLAKPNPDLI